MNPIKILSGFLFSAGTLRESTTLRVMAAVVMVALAVGCATYPLGLSKEQWEALPVEQQLEYQTRQFELDEQRRQQQAILREQRRIEQEAAARAEQERIMELYRNARYGDIIRVNVQGGLLQLHKNSYYYHPVSFELARGESKYISVTRTGNIAESASFLARLSEDGNTLFFDENSRDQVVMVNSNWEQGQLYRSSNSTGSGIRLVGATFQVKLKDLPGAPSRIIIENR